MIAIIVFLVMDARQDDLADEGRKIILGAEMIGVTKYEFATMKSYANAAGASEYELERAYDSLRQGRTTVGDLCKKWSERAKPDDLARLNAHNHAAISAAER